MDGITGREDQKRDEKAPICCDMHGRNCEPPSELCCRDCSEAAHDTFPIRHADGSVCSAPGAAQGGFERMLADPYEQFDQRGELLKSVERIKEAAYRAGREDLLRSGSCPECAAGDPHNEPDVPHIHLTPYGYLLYAADHERPGFIEEIRAVERRAGREDAARDLRTAVRLIGTECENFRSGTCVDSGRRPDARYTVDRWCDHCILREALAGVGVQPTEEQPDE